MTSRRCLSTRAALRVALALALFPGAAHAKAHLWKFTEAFSNADGSVQFIEMFVFDPAGTGEIFLAGHDLSSDGNSYVFPNNLPMENTFERWILIATPDFAALPGAPKPDYTIPPQFFDPAGDALVYRFGLDVLTIPPGAMPIDGIRSLEPDLDTPVNSPTNFAGEEGSISLAPAVPLGALAPWVLAAAVAALGSIALLRRSEIETRETRGS